MGNEVNHTQNGLVKATFILAVVTGLMAVATGVMAYLTFISVQSQLLYVQLQYLKGELDIQREDLKSLDQYMYATSAVTVIPVKDDGLCEKMGKCKDFCKKYYDCYRVYNEASSSYQSILYYLQQGHFMAARKAIPDLATKINTFTDFYHDAVTTYWDTCAYSTGQ